MSGKQTLPPMVTAQLKRMIVRVRLIVLARGLLAVLAVAVGAVLAIMAVDAAVVLFHPAARWAASLSGVALVAAVAWSMWMRPFSRPLTVTRMARVLETRHPDMQERISSAIELAANGGEAAARASEELVALLTQDAAKELSGVCPNSEFTGRTIRPFLNVMIVVTLVMMLLFALWPRACALLFLRAVAPFREFDTLSARTLKVQPGDVLMIEKSPLRIEVSAPGRPGGRAEILFSRAGTKTSVERMRKLSEEGAEKALFELDMPSVATGFVYRVRYGTGITRPYTVKVVTEPSLVETRVDYQYPAYTGLQATQVVGVAQDVKGVAGTKVSVSAVFNRSASSVLRIGRFTLPAGATGPNAVWNQTLSTSRKGRWAVQIRDQYGFTNRLADAMWDVIPDRPPKVNLVTPAQSRLKVPPYERLVCAAVAQDDFGMGTNCSLVIELEKDKRPALTVPVERASETERVVRLTGTPDLQALYDQGVREFKLFLRISDNRPPEFGGGQVGKSRVVTVTLDPQARVVDEQVREDVKKKLEEKLREAAQDLRKAADSVAQERNSLDKPDLSEKTVNQLEEARKEAVKAEQLMEQAARETEKGAFEKFAETILDVRDEKVEEAFKKLEAVPGARPEERQQAGAEAEKALRDAAEKVNELANQMLQKEDQRLEEQNRLAALAKKEEFLARQAESAKMNRQEMQDWVNQQNALEQQLQQSKAQEEKAKVAEAMEGVREAREAMRKADQALTAEADQALRREAQAADKVREMANAAEEAAQQAVEAATQAETLAETRQASAEMTQAAEEVAAAAELAAEAAEAAQQAAQGRQAEETLSDMAAKQEAAQQAMQAAEAAAEAAELAEAAAEAANQAVRAQQDGKQDQAALEDAMGQAEVAAEAAADAMEEAAASQNEAQEQGLEQASAADRLASESAERADRTAELAAQATEQAQQAAGQTEEQKAESMKEAEALAQQAQQAAAEAQGFADQALQQAQAQLDQLAQAEKAAEANRPEAGAVEAQAQEAVADGQAAAEEAQQAGESVDAAAESVGDVPAFSEALDRLAEAAGLAEQAADLAERSGASMMPDSSQEAAAADPAGQPENSSSQAAENAAMASQLAQEASEMADQAAQEISDRATQSQQASQESAQQAAQQAGEAAKKAAQAQTMANQAGAEELAQAAQKGATSASLTGESAKLVQQALEKLSRSDNTADSQAMRQAQSGREKAEEALSLAREALERAAEEQAVPDGPQQQAAREAREAAEMMAAAVQQQQQAKSEAWSRVESRLGGSMSHSDHSTAGSAPNAGASQVSASPDWILFKGQAGAAAYEEMLRRTPVEYRELVKAYFETLAGESVEGKGKK